MSLSGMMIDIIHSPRMAGFRRRRMNIDKRLEAIRKWKEELAEQYSVSVSAVVGRAETSLLL